MNPAFSSKELEALQMAADGESSLEIAKKWKYTATRTADCGPCHVRAVWKRVRDKLGADNITQAVAMALRRGIIQ